MLPNEFQHLNELGAGRSGPRIGDLAAMLRVMTPLNGSLPNAEVGRRQLLADLCRFIGVKVGTLPGETLEGIATPAPISSNANATAQPAASGTHSNPGDTDPAGISTDDLSPRQEQTLRHLLAGDSEKQVAHKLELSKHTVHVYVKAIYRRFGVSSRAELLAKHLKK
jgi:DNA-binding CsgD family transcriptional regulator